MSEPWLILGWAGAYTVAHDIRRTYAATSWGASTMVT